MATGVITSVTTVNSGAVSALTYVALGSNLTKAFGVNGDGTQGYYTIAELGGADPMPTIGPTSWKIRSDGTTPSYQPTDELVAHTASLTNITISSPGATIGGLAMTAGVGQRVLLVGQTDPKQNGLWVYNTPTTAMVRPEDYPAGGSFNLN